MRPVSSLRVAFLFALSASCIASTRVEAAPARGTSPDARPGTTANICCDDVSLPNYGRRINFNSNFDGEEITNQFRPMGLLFGKGATVNAPMALVSTDYTRRPECELVLTGTPAFSGWEFFVFVDSLQQKWARVQNVGVHLGYCDFHHSGFVAAYDRNGTLLEAQFNDVVGFDFVSIQRPTADIAMVMVGDCASAGGVCYPDPGGSAFTCMTYSTPITTTFAFPSAIPLPPPPPATVAGTPGFSAWGIAFLALGLLAASLGILRRRSSHDEAMGLSS